MNKSDLTLIILSGVILGATLLLTLRPHLTYEANVNLSLFHHTNYGQQPWYKAPMQGRTVELRNGSIYLVIADYWNSCEHNPDQLHLIGIGYVNRTAYDERVRLDVDVSTRNYTATHLLVVWVDACSVVKVLP